MNGRVSEDLPRDLFVFHDEKNQQTSKISRIFGTTILDQVFDQLDPERKTLRQILEEIRHEIKTGGQNAIIFPVTSVNEKTGDVKLTPHDIGLGNVDNTSDMAKPLSAPQRDTVLSILANYPFSPNLKKYDDHIVDTNNPHDVTVEQLDKNEELTKYIDRNVAKWLYKHTTDRSDFIHHDIKNSIREERRRITELQSLFDRTIEINDRNIATLFATTTDHSVQLSERELLSNKVNVFDEVTNSTNRLYPSTRAVVHYMRKKLKDLNLVTLDGIVSDIKVIEKRSQLPTASKANYREIYIIRRGRGSKIDIAMCRKADSMYYWDINDIGAYSKYDARYFIDTSEGLSLNLQAIFNAITEGEGLLQEIYSSSGKNVLTGFHGYTYDAGNTNFAGEVNTVLFSIPFKVVKAGKPTISLRGNFKARMGDGSYISLSNPNILSVTNSTASIQFTMENVYPSNSPCMLVFANLDSRITVDGSLNDSLVNDAGVGFEKYCTGSEEKNVLTGFYGLTIESSPADPNGEVNKAIISIPFKRHKINIPSIYVDGIFKLYMGDGNLIPVENPTIADITTTSVSIEFTMTRTYPSNSPCMLVFGNSDSIITVTGDDEITDINIPEEEHEYFKPTEISSHVHSLPFSGGEVKFTIKFDVFNEDVCNCPANFLTFGNIRSINLLPGTMDGCIRYYVNGDMSTMKEMRVPGLQTMAFQEFLIDSNFPNHIIASRHIGNRVINHRHVEEKGLRASNLLCNELHVIGNMNDPNGIAQQISIAQLGDSLQQHYGYPFGYNGLDIILSPHLWVPDRVYDLRDQSFGIRFKGTTSALPNHEITNLLSSEIKMDKYQLVDAGGSWFYSTSPNAQAILGGSNITGFTFATIILDNRGLLLTSISTGNRLNAPYDLWVRFVDPTKIG